MSGSYGRPPPDTSRMVSLKVDNLTYDTTVEDLQRTFRKYGEVGDVYIPRNPFTKESRGFAFVRFYDKREAEDAMDAMDGATLDGRELRVQFAKYGRPEPRRQRYRGGGGGGYGGGRYRRDRDYRRRSRSRSPRRRSRSLSRSRSRSPQRRRSYSRSQSPVRRNSRSRSKSPYNRRSRSGSPQNRSRSGSRDN